MPNINIEIICPDAGVPSGCCDADGAVDFEVTLMIDGDVLRKVGVTLIPDPCTGRLESWGNLDHWLEDRGCELVRYLEDAGRDLAGEIVGVCAEARDRGHCTSTIEIADDVIGAHAAEVASNDVHDWCTENPGEIVPADGWDDAACNAGAAQICHVPAIVEGYWYAAYDRAARAAAAERRESFASDEAAS